MIVTFSGSRVKWDSILSPLLCGNILQAFSSQLPPPPVRACSGEDSCHQACLASFRVLQLVREEINSAGHTSLWCT